MKKSTKFLLLTIGTAITGIYVYNRFIEKTATKHNLLSDLSGEYYTWKHGKIYYTKSGNGSPLLLIHDINSSASSEEWKKIIHRFEKNHTVYTLDLLGCGRSDKPAMEYTNYLYVQLLKDFIKDIIQEKTTVVATNISASSVILTNNIDSELFDKMIFINPVSLKQLNIIPNDKTKLLKRIIELPFIGTFIYNIMNNSKKIDKAFRTEYYENAHLISSSIEDIYYESAHLKQSKGKYLYSSIIGNYLNNSAAHAVKNISTPTLIIGSRELNNYNSDLDDYDKLNENITITKLTNGNLYPHLEIPDKIYTVIKDFIIE